METAGVPSAGTGSMSLAAASAGYSAHLLRKVLDIESAQGAALVQMVAQSAGLGRSLDTSA